MHDVSVIIPARDSAATLGATLERLAAQSFDGSWEVIVVDDGSTDDTTAVARAAPGPVRCIGQPPSGPGAARNAAVEASQAPLLAFTDADCLPASNWLERGVAALDGADLVQGAVLPDPTAPLGPFDRTLYVTADTGLWQTANLFTTRETFCQVGGFRDWLRPARSKVLGEDVLFGWQAIRCGARARFEPEVLVHHAVFARGPSEFLAERMRLRYFPELVAQVPELRRTMFVAHTFLNARSAAFDVALGALALAIARRSAIPLVAALPYIRRVTASRRGGGGRFAAVEVAADVTGLTALLYGSARARSLLI